MLELVATWTILPNSSVYLFYVKNQLYILIQSILVWCIIKSFSFLKVFMEVDQIKYKINLLKSSPTAMDVL